MVISQHQLFALPQMPLNTAILLKYRLIILSQTATNPEKALIQAEAMEQADAGINRISEVVQSNSAASEESSATSEELSAQAMNMSDLVARFQLRD